MARDALANYSTLISHARMDKPQKPVEIGVALYVL